MSKMKDFINYKEKEVQCSFVLSLLIVFLFYFFGLYNNFIANQERIVDIAETMLGGLVGLLGFSIGGIAIIVSLFSREEIDAIEKINGNKVIERFLNSYVFLTCSIAMEIIEFIIVIFAIMSNISLLGPGVFGILFWLVVYHLLFNIFYLVALVKNCAELYEIKQIYGKVHMTEKNWDNEINDVRIDFIMSTLMNMCNCSQEELVEYMIEFVQNEGKENSEKIRTYIQKKYGVK